MSLNEISAEELNKLIINNSQITLVDVRTAGEFNSTHINGSKNLPLGSTDLKNLNRENQNDQIIFICQGGSRAKSACSEFTKETNSSAFILVGGLNSWLEKGFPVIKGAGSISMERQVRIAAGLLVFLGTSFSIMISPLFIVIPIIVGLGLMFSGITDTCGMARVLAYMPWNSQSCCNNNCNNK